MRSISGKINKLFFLLIVTIFCISVLVVSFGCSSNNYDGHNDKTDGPGSSNTSKPAIDAKKTYIDAEKRFNEYDSVELDLQCDIVLSDGENTVNTFLVSRINEKNRNSQDYQMIDSSILRIGNQEALITETVYKDGKYYFNSDVEKIVSDLTYDEYCEYINEDKDEYYGTDTKEDSYNTYIIDSYLDGSRITYNECNKESSFLKGEIVSALLLCGLEIDSGDVTVIESSGSVELNEKKAINREERVISAEINLFDQKLRVTVIVEVNVISFNVDMSIATPDAEEYCAVPHPSFSGELSDLYCSLAEKEFFSLTDEKEVKFVVNNTQATYTDENTIIYHNDGSVNSFNIDFSQTIKCSKLSPKTTTNKISESFSAETGKYVAYENKDKVSDLEITAKDAKEYVEQQLAYLVPDFMLFDSITTSLADDGTVATYTFDLSEEYVQAYCAYYITYYDSSLSGYPYDSTAIEAAKGQIIIIADAMEGIIKNVMTSMSCKYNYQNKYTVSFNYSGITECAVEK